MTLLKYIRIFSAKMCLLFCVLFFFLNIKRRLYQVRKVNKLKRKKYKCIKKEGEKKRHRLER